MGEKCAWRDSFTESGPKRLVFLYGNKVWMDWFQRKWSEKTVFSQRHMKGLFSPRKWSEKTVFSQGHLKGLFPLKKWSEKTVGRFTWEHKRISFKESGPKRRLVLLHGNMNGIIPEKVLWKTVGRFTWAYEGTCFPRKVLWKTVGRFPQESGLKKNNGWLFYMEIWKDLFQTKSGPNRRMVFLHGIYHSESGLKSQLVVLHGKYGRNCFKEIGPKRRVILLHWNILIIIHSFYIPLFFALEQTHCAH